jgi:hypothetical protein
MLTLTRDRITSDVTSHYAERDVSGGGWRLSFLSGHWTENQALAGMRLADAVAEPLEGGGVPTWIAGFAGILDEPVEELVAAAQRPPEDAQRWSA